MFIGIIAEGRSDVAVIENVLQGTLSIDRRLHIQHLQPEFDLDETDLHTPSLGQYSNWGLVKQACLEQKKFTDFFMVAEERYIVIHLDSAEAEDKEFDVPRPAKHQNPAYSQELRQRIMNKIQGWLHNQFHQQLFYAIAIEEIEAWVLAIYTDQHDDTCKYSDPKKELERVLNRKLSGRQRHVLTYDPFQRFDALSREFRKRKELLKYANRNESLKLFCESLRINSMIE